MGVSYVNPGDKATASKINEIIDHLGPSIFGDGSDGDVTISADTTLSRDMYYNNLTISAGCTLNPNGWIIFVKDTLTIDGTIARNGNDGSGRTGGAALSTYTAGGSGAGGTGGYHVGCQKGSRGGDGFYGGSGGAGRDGANCVAGAGGSSPKVAISNPIIEFSNNLGGAGGGGGGADTGGSSGGGGGSGGGVIAIFARNINNNGAIEAKGGNGAAYGFFGGGGGGGCVIIVYLSKSGSGTIDVSGGLAGGAGAYDGDAGNVVEIQV